MPRVKRQAGANVRFAEEDVERLVRDARGLASPRPERRRVVVDRRLPRRF